MSDIWQYNQELSLIDINNPILHQKAEEVKTFDWKLHQLISQIRNCIKTNDALKEGIAGLAAPQIGIPLQIIMIDTAMYSDKSTIIECINPVYEPKNTQVKLGIEGCFSVPNKYGIVPRFAKIKVTYKTIDGIETPLQFDDTEKFSTQEGQFEKCGARIFQHEIDHLFGKLYPEVEGTILFDSSEEAKEALNKIGTTLFNNLDEAIIALDKIKNNSSSSTKLQLTAN